ncbi:MAG: AraC family transcriptional regulator [Candidatus Competibacteraceae bacterium]|jgi:AraC-like DNA-binding protein|nr:AraC family transcriptional regulator [Candidatus Competibacteraceae bacterium]
MTAQTFVQKQPVQEGYLRVGPLVCVPQILRERGVDPAEIVTGTGLDLTLFDDPEKMLEFANVGRLLRWCEVRLQCPHFGLLIGRRSGIECLGVLGGLLRFLPNIGSVLHALVNHLHIHDRGAVLELSVEHNAAVLSYLIYQQGVEGTNHIHDGAIAIAFNILRELCGSTWLPTEVLFSRRPPHDMQPYKRFFQAPLRFDVERTALVFPAKWLDQPRVDVDSSLRRQLEHQITALENTDDYDLVVQIRRVLRIILIAHRSTLEQVAELFSIHSRTLNRRLLEQGYTFRGLTDEVRFEIARQLLENSRMPIGQIAATLHYSETCAFTRAFRRWSGVTPKAWRSRARPGN